MDKRLKNNQGVALMMSMVVVFFLSILIGVLMMRSQSMIHTVMVRNDSQYSFYAAESGINRVLYELRSNTNWRPDPALIYDVTVQDGQNPSQTQIVGHYSLDVQTASPVGNWPALWVRSFGVDTGLNIPRVIMAKVIVSNPARFLISTPGNLIIGSGVTLNNDILGNNIIFQPNPSIPPGPNRDINVNGSVYYITSYSGNQDPAVHIVPNVAPIHSPSVSFTGVDLPRYRNLAQSLALSNQGIYSLGSLTVDLANPNPGSPNAPQIIFAEGDVHVAGGYSASMLVVSGGNIYIDGDIIPQPSGNVTQTPQIGLLSAQDVVIENIPATYNLTINAFVMADGQGPNSDGVFMSQGAPFSRGSLNFTGAISVRGKNPSPTVSAINLNAYQYPRTYNFDPALSSNASIPFIPYIANIYSWQEISPHDSFPPNPP